MRAAAVVAMLAVAAGPARADEVGLVVNGDDAKHDEIAARMKGWLKKHGHTARTDALDADGVQSLSECLAIDDQSCARSVIDKHAQTESVVYAALQSTGKRSLSVTMYWFIKGHQSASERRGCEKCTADGLGTLTDDMLFALAKSSEQTGRLVIKSRPSDLLVLVDNEAVGQTPVEKDLLPGRHRVVISQDGENVGEKLVEIEAGDTTRVTLTAHSASQTGRKIGSIALITAGFGLLVTAGVLVSYGTKDGPTEMYVYDNATGIGLISGGVGLLGIVGGALLWPRATQRAVPIAQVGPGGGLIGLAGRF